MLKQLFKKKLVTKHKCDFNAMKQSEGVPEKLVSQQTAERGSRRGLRGQEADL